MTTNKKQNIMKRPINVEKGTRGFVPVENKRDKRVIFRLTDQEMQELLQQAEEKGLSKSDYLRELIKLDK